MTTRTVPLPQTPIVSTSPLASVSLSWMRGAQALWLVIAFISVIVIVASLPITYERYLQPCDGGPQAGCLYGQINRAAMDDLKASTLRPEWVFGFFVVLMLGERLLEIVLSGMMIWYGHRERYALLWGFIVLTCSMSVVDYQTALGETHPLIWLYRFGGWFNALSLTIAFVCFPDGRFRPRWSLYGAVLFTLLIPLFVLLTGMQNAPPAGSQYYNAFLLLNVAHSLFLLALLIYRYHHVFTRPQRQQVKWFIYSLLVGLVIGLLWDLLWSQLAPGVDRATSATYILTTNFLKISTIGLTFVGFTIVILRYRLWDIDIIIHRTLVYGSLTALVAALYVLLVGTLSALFQSNGSLIVSLLATGVVAVIFQPLRERIQQGVNRIVFGERSSPYTVISRLSERLEANVSPGTLLPGIVEMVAQAFKLTYVAIELKAREGFKTDAVYGQPAEPGRSLTLPLMYGQETVGQMVIGQAAGDRTLDQAEYQLLENIARQTGIAAHAVQLSLSLQQSRQQIVTAREEERRRLRRDLHDGLGPSLAAHTIKVGAARALIDSHPQIAAIILTELETSLATSLLDIRRLVYNLRPPALDQLGLDGALRDFIQQCTGTTVFTLHVPQGLPPLPAAVEVAAYRIVQEAVTNVLRHAGARQGSVELHIDVDLGITVQDDGAGLPPDMSYGVGLISMRERAEELGGQFTIASQVDQGTKVHVRLPYELNEA
jgi:signal transduction histidine kinase